MPLVQLAGVEKENLPAARKALARVGAQDVRVIDMAQGNKVSRILAWSFLDDGSARPGGPPREMIEDGAQWRHGPCLFFRSDVDSFAAFHSIVFLPVFCSHVSDHSRAWYRCTPRFFVLADETFIKWDWLDLFTGFESNRDR